jgi:hypothetical protein
MVAQTTSMTPNGQARWAAHNVRAHQTGQKRLHHPAVGDLDLTYEAMELRADPGLTLLVYTAEPDSKTDSLNPLGHVVGKPRTTQRVRS